MLKEPKNVRHVRTRTCVNCKHLTVDGHDFPSAVCGRAWQHGNVVCDPMEIESTVCDYFVWNNKERD